MMQRLWPLTVLMKMVKMKSHSRLLRLRSIMMGLLGPIVVLCCFTLAACQSQPTDDLTLGNEAYDRYEISDAEMFYERYLRKNPESINRWWVWNRLLDISLNIRQQKTTSIGYLEIMLEEYGKDDDKRRSITGTLANLYFDVRNYERAVLLWENNAYDPTSLAAEKAEAFRKLAFLYLRRLDFSDSTNVLQRCLQLDVEQSAKADCLFDLAEIQLLLGELPQAYANLHTLLQLDDPDKERYLMVRFMYADVLEQKGRLDEALELFTQLRTIHPNQGAIDIRIEALQKKIKKKK